MDELNIVESPETTNTYKKRNPVPKTRLEHYIAGYAGLTDLLPQVVSVEDESVTGFEKGSTETNGGYKYSNSTHKDGAIQVTSPAEGNDAEAFLSDYLISVIVTANGEEQEALFTNSPYSEDFVWPEGVDYLFTVNDDQDGAPPYCRVRVWGSQDAASEIDVTVNYYGESVAIYPEPKTNKEKFWAAIAQNDPSIADGVDPKTRTELYLALKSEAYDQTGLVAKTPLECYMAQWAYDTSDIPTEKEVVRLPPEGYYLGEKSESVDAFPGVISENSYRYSIYEDASAPFNAPLIRLDGEAISVSISELKSGNEPVVIDTFYTREEYSELELSNDYDGYIVVQEPHRDIIANEIIPGQYDMQIFGGGGSVGGIELVVTANGRVPKYPKPRTLDEKYWALLADVPDLSYEITDLYPRTKTQYYFHKLLNRGASIPGWDEESDDGGGGKK